MPAQLKCWRHTVHALLQENASCIDGQWHREITVSGPFFDNVDASRLAHTSVCHLSVALKTFNALLSAWPINILETFVRGQKKKKKKLIINGKESKIKKMENQRKCGRTSEKLMKALSTELGQTKNCVFARYLYIKFLAFDCCG